MVVAMVFWPYKVLRKKNLLVFEEFIVLSVSFLGNKISCGNGMIRHESCIPILSEIHCGMVSRSILRILVRVYLSNVGPTATSVWGEFEKNPTCLTQMCN